MWLTVGTTEPLWVRVTLAARSHITELDNKLEKYLSPEQVANAIPGVTVGALAQLRYLGKGPRFRKPTAKTVLYVEEEVVQWVEDSARTKTGVAGE